MSGRWETLILLLCELLVSVCAETVDQQREEEQRCKESIIMLHSAFKQEIIHFNASE